MEEDLDFLYAAAGLATAMQIKKRNYVVKKWGGLPRALPGCPSGLWGACGS